jgi:hypothetical protein
MILFGIAACNCYSITSADILGISLELDWGGEFIRLLRCAIVIQGSSRRVVVLFLVFKDWY